MRHVFLPRTMQELWDILEREPKAAIYAGGTDLLVKLRGGLLDPPALVCLERVEALRGIRDHGEEIFIGAATSHRRILEHPAIGEHFPVLAKAIAVLGSPPIRHMGTIGGNIVTASPAGDTLPPLYVLDAEVEVASPAGTRSVPVCDFILGPGSVNLEQGEVLAGVRLRKAPVWQIHHYEKVGRRKAQACSVASLAALLALSESGTVKRARLAWGSVGPTVVTSGEIEEALIGKPLTRKAFEQAAVMARRAVSPIDDIRAGADYRRHVAGALLFRLTV